MVIHSGLLNVASFSAGYTNAFNIGALMEKGVRLIGNGQAPVHLYWEEILHDYSILTHRVPLDDMQALYEAFDKRQAGVEKVFVETAFSSPPAPGCPKTSRVNDWAV